MNQQPASIQAQANHQNTRYTQYPDYESTTVPWIDALPSHWESMKLGYDARLIVPQRDKPSSLNGEIPWVRIEDFDGQFISDSKDGKGVSQKTVQEMNLKVYPKGTVLCSCSCDMGATAIVKKPLVSNQTFIGIVPGERLESRYIYYLMQVAKDHLNALATGAIQQYLSKTDFSNLRLPLPSRKEQQRLTEFLDRETGKIARLIDKKERLIELLEERRTALITKAVTKGLDPDVPMKDSGVEWLGGTPEHWDLVSLRNLSPNITVGIVVKPTDHYAPEGVPCLRSQNVKLAEITRENLVFIDEAANRELEKSQIHSGDLVTVRTGDPGTTAVVPPDLDGANCVDLIIIREPELADQRWLCWFMNSEAANVQYRIWSGGAAQQHLNVGAVKQVRVPVPPIDEQRAIGEHIDQHNHYFKQVKEKLIKAIVLLKEYRSALITAAVTGKIDVRGHAA